VTLIVVIGFNTPPQCQLLSKIWGRDLSGKNRCTAHRHSS